MHPTLLAASYLALAFAKCAAAADNASGPVPDWLRGDWIVAKVYEGGGAYPDPPAEPKVRFIGQTLTVEADKLRFIDDICADATARETSATFKRLLRESIASTEPRTLGLANRPGKIKHLEITCGRSLSDTSLGMVERYIGEPFKWQVIRRDDDTIEMPFFVGSFLVLHRQKPTS